jgi:cyclomaltodextrinase / maltogenic alpha-amylase / neopullulanase
LAHYKKLINIRNTYKPLQLGDYQTLLADDGNELYAFQRTFQGQKVIVVINNSPLERKISLPSDKNSLWVDVLNENHQVKDAKGVSIKPKWGAILVLK